jgi:hypothetical protein
MGALSIAFETIIVGSLALTWVLLVIHLFFSDKEPSIAKLLDWVGRQNQPALAGVLLFAMAYSLGSAVSRIAQDFFDDDDMHFHIGKVLFRVGVTESSIRTDVYCHTLPSETQTLNPEETLKPGNPIAKKESDFQDDNAKCVYTGRWILRQIATPKHEVSAPWLSKQEDRAEEIFRFQEAMVLLQGTDPTERLRQFHDQIMVLRGAAFDGMLAFSLCLFWWGAKFRSWLRWAVLLPYLLPGTITTWNHFHGHPDGPPFMEFTLLSLAAAGCRLLWKYRTQENEDGTVTFAKENLPAVRLSYVALSLFLTISAILGWWATQVLYDEQVIYSYQALSAAPIRPPLPPVPK